MGPRSPSRAGTTPKTYPVGTVNVAAPGYVKVDMQGVTKDGGYFGDVSGLSVTTTSALDYANDPANYYCHEYFYNEVTVPTGQDVVGSYFMVAGFSAGYSGIQVRENDRWVLFSVWDADDGQKTTLVSKGAGVVDNSFGGEGTGGQATLYSAWFFAPESNSWRYLATWKRPSTNTYQSGVHSFLENFLDTRGYTGRRATAGRFTGDATATNAQRKDYAGGLENGRFYLRNGAFFPDYVPLNQNFNRPATGQQPTVDVNTLPTQ
ncbi:hypothetical protein B0H14DRAFT_3739779 [Mycena olivaceomarginata]|nr:hypothetical protein B0H14DRAFT_3739779 [Mycena olivaceomarginata]